MPAESPQPFINIQSFCEGDNHEFEKVFNLYYDRMYLFAQNLIKTQADAKDIVSRSFIKLWDLHKHFDNLEGIKAFLYVTTRNTCIDYLRRLQRLKKAQKELLYLPDNDKGIENAMIEAEFFNELALHIENLPPQCKAVFKAMYFENLSTPEVAERLGMTTQNVLNQKGRAIQILRSGLIKKGLLKYDQPMI